MSGLPRLDVVIANSNTHARPPEATYAQGPVRIDLPEGTGEPRLVVADVVDVDNAHKHDPLKLAATLIRLLEERQAQQPPPSVVPRSA